MHEYSVAYDVYATAKRAADEHNATEVRKIFVDVGEMTMVNPEQVKFLFDVIREEDPVFHNAVLEYRQVAVRVRCACGYEGGEYFVCPGCGGLPEVIAGREIVVTNIEIEVDDDES
ncbi:MAG TPA: hydrogenase maturation nickel metallochaperone HypA [Methanoculleus sp.]|nr:hydrogenase maturation nickel metallochaperone HypA [Methanoculleus sp.]